MTAVPVPTVPVTGTPLPTFYVVSGTLPLTSHSYVPRQADADLLSALLGGEYCFVLNSRQMGKSSLSVRTMARLQAQGVKTVFLDLTKFGGSNVTPEQWYIGMLSETGRALGMRKEFLAYWKENAEYSLVQRYIGALHDVALTQIPGRIVLFVDEIDSIKSLQFSADEFFAAIRECYNRRVQEPEYGRLAFALVGSATPSDLIQDTRTSPFNIGKRIELKDFTLAETLPLAEGLVRPNARLLIERAFYWTNGHPFLTQAVCAEIAANERTRTPADVDALVAGMFFEAKARERNVNLADVSNRILSSYLDTEQKEERRAAILELYKQVRSRREKVADDETNRLISILKLSGITRTAGGWLEVRNRIYERVFDQQWIAQSMPDAELRRQQAAYRRGLVRATLIAAAMMSVLVGLTWRAATSERRARNAAVMANQQKERAERLYYIASMNLIQQAWEASAPDIVQIRELLAETRHSPYRGFEWGYWRRKLHLEQRELAGHAGGITSVAFSPDGRQLLTGSYDFTARIWDAETGQQKSVLASKNIDTRGFTYISINTQQTAFSPDGRRVATGSGSTDNWGYIWDAATGKLLTTLKRKPKYDGFSLSSIVFSPDGRRVAAAFSNQDSCVWDAASGQEQLVLKGHCTVKNIAFSPDGAHIATGCDYAGNAVKVCDAVSGQQLFALKLTAYSGAIAYSPDGKRLALAENGGTTRIWDAVTGQPLSTLSGKNGVVSSVAFSPDGKSLLIGEDNAACLRDAATGQELDVFKGHAGEVTSVEFSPNGRQVITGSTDGTARIWDVSRPKEIISLKGSDTNIGNMAISPDGRQILSSTDNNQVLRLWDTDSGQETRQFKERLDRAYCIASSPDGKRALVIKEKTAGIWDMATGQEILKLKDPIQNVYLGVFSPDGQRVATGGKDASLWDVESGQKLKTLTVPGYFMGLPAFSPDGKRILLGNSYNNEDKLVARIYDAASGRALIELAGTSSCTKVAFSPDGKSVVTGLQNNTARIWDAATGRQQLVLRNMDGYIFNVAFSPDGRRILTGSVTTASMWDAATGRALLDLKGHHDAVVDIVMPSQGDRIITAGEGGLVGRWQSLSEAEISEIEHREARQQESVARERRRLNIQP